jgi:hypothetical protein
MRRRHFTLIGLAGVAQVVLDARQGVSGSPVDTWTGAPGTSVNATASGSARPTTGTLNGQPALVYDGTNTWMNAVATGASLFRNASHGRIVCVVNSETGTRVHAEWFNALGFARLSNLRTTIGGRRLDSDTFVSVTPSAPVIPHITESIANWSGNILGGAINGALTGTVAFSSGGGSTSDTDSTAVNIGGRSTGNIMLGLMAAVIATNQDWSAAFAARVRHCLAFTFMIPQAA